MSREIEFPDYCGRCGGETLVKEIDDRARAICKRCETVHWQNPKPASATAVIDEKKILLVQRGVEPDKGQWSLPAGFIEADESFSEGALRELKEEAGIDTSENQVQPYETLKITQLESEHVVVVTFIVNRSDTCGEVSAGTDAAAAEFWDYKQFKSNTSKVREPYRDVIQALFEYTG